MAWSDVPRSKKVLILSLSVLVLAIGLAYFGTGGGKSPSADVNTDNTLLDAGLDSDSITVLVKATNADGTPRQAFVDALVDNDANCTVDAGERDGYTGETEADGTLRMSLPSGYYVLRGTDIDSSATGDVAIAVGAVSGASCMQAVPVANTEPVTIRLSEGQ